MRRDKSGQAVPGKTKRLMDDPTVSGLGGTVLRLNDQPLSGVTVSIDKHSVRTDREGRFALRGIAPGHHELVVDGRTAGPRSREYLQVIDDDKPRAQEQRTSIVAPAKPSPKAEQEARTKRTEEGLPVHSFQTLLADLATIAKNRIQPKNCPARNPSIRSRGLPHYSGRLSIS